MTVPASPGPASATRSTQAVCSPARSVAGACTAETRRSAAARTTVAMRASSSVWSGSSATGPIAARRSRCAPPAVEATVPSRSMRTSAASASGSSVQRRVPAVIAHVPRAGSIVATAPCSCAGTAWVSTTPVAVVGPSLRTVIRQAQRGADDRRIGVDRRGHRYEAAPRDRHGGGRRVVAEVVSVPVVVTDTLRRLGRARGATAGAKRPGDQGAAAGGDRADRAAGDARGDELHPDGTGSVATTPVASDGPLLAIVAVTVVVSPGAIEAGEAASATDTPERDVGVGGVRGGVVGGHPVARRRDGCRVDDRAGGVLAGADGHRDRRPRDPDGERIGALAGDRPCHDAAGPAGARRRAVEILARRQHVGDADRPRRRDRARVGHREGVGGRRAAHE